MKVSIVTPSYNQAQFIEETIQSVLTQDYPHVEYIVMDGGSHDGSADIIRQYEKKLAFWVSQPDAGQADAVNKGWSKTSGEIIAYLNADDRYVPGAISTVMEQFQRFPELGIIYGSCYTNWADKQISRIYQPPDFNIRRLLLENYIPQPTAFFRRTLLQQVGFLDASLRYCMDYDFWLRAALNGIRFHRVNTPLAYFRVWSGSKTSQDAAGWLKERLAVIDRAFDQPHFPDRLRPLRRYARARSYVSVSYGVSLSGDLQSAKSFLRQAAWTAPAIVKDKQFLSIGTSLLIGSRASRWVRRIKWVSAGSGNGTSTSVKKSISIPMGSLHLSGGVKVLVLFANGLAEQGWQVTLFVPDFGSSSPFHLHPDVEVRVVSSGLRFFPGPLRKIIYYLKLSFLSAREFDVCCANYYLTAYCALISRFFSRRKTKIVWYVQAYEAGSHGLLAQAGFLSRRLRYIAAQLSYKLPLKIYCVSRWVREKIRRPDAEVLHPPALDLSVFSPVQRPLSRKEIVIGTIGRQGATKGYGDFLKALEEIPNTEQIRIIVASPVKNEVPLPSRFPSESLNPTTEMAMADFYRRLDIFVLSSRMEGFPLPPLEAMACGCAVLTTACGGVSEYAQNGRNCLVVPAGAPDQLGKALRKLSSNAALRESLSQEGIRTAEQLSQEKAVQRFSQVIFSL